MKLFITKLLLSVVLLIVGTGAGVGYYAFNKFQTPAPTSTEKIVSIPKGFGTVQIAEQLQREGIVSDSYVFALVSKFIGGRETLKAGEYQFAPAVPMRAVIIKIKKGDIYKRQFTIPEGLTSFEIVERLKSVPDIQVSDVAIPAEGTLLPETYQYAKGEPLAAILARMETSLVDVMAEEWGARDANLPFQNVMEALTLASIVEKETGVASERKRIAGVFINRLRIGMPLQTDPTVIYALTGGRPQNAGKGPLGRRLLLKDLAVDSPYNTYKNMGLPPTPIANAGEEAIKAVLHPEYHDFLFFVADGKGGHVFSKTLSEHNKHVAMWRKKRRDTGIADAP